MATVLVSSRKAARARLLGGAHVGRYDFPAWVLDIDTHLGTTTTPTPRHRADQETTS